jgi:hypothetical protein
MEQINILDFFLFTCIFCASYLVYVFIKTIIQTKKINKNKPFKF